MFGKYTKLTLLLLCAMTLLSLRAEELKLSSNGTTSYTILLPENPLPTDVKASEELRDYLKKITDVEFPVSSSANGKVISIGKTALAEQVRPQGWTAKLGDDGYGIAVKNGNLFLFGGPGRGALNAVYAFLEDDLGCHWFSPKVERIPHKSELTVDINNCTSVPAFPHIRDSLNGCAHNTDWALRNRTDQLYLKIPKELGGHHVNYTTPWYAHTYDLIAPRNLFKSHPEYFAMNANGTRNPGQRCPLNPGFQQRAINWALNELRKKPDCNYVMVGICDTTAYCHCPKCTAAIKRGGSKSTPAMKLLNKVAGEVAKEFPKARVSTLAYWATGLPPKKIKFHPNVVIWLCTDCLAAEIRHKPIYTSKRFVERMNAWKKIAPEIHIWDYHCTFHNYLHYDTTLYSMTENLRYYAKNGVKGVQLQGDTTVGGERETLRAWVLAKLMWNPQLDPLKLMKEYCEGVFGRAAGKEIFKFYRQIYFMGKSGKTPANPRAVKEPEMLRIAGLAAFNKAYAALKRNGNDPELKKLLDLEALPVIILQLEYLTGRIEQSAGNPAAVAGLRKQFDKLYAKFEATTKREGIRFFREGGHMDLLLAKLKLWDFKKHPRKLPKDGILISADHGRIIWNSGPSFRKDPESGSGVSLRLPYTRAEYPVRWNDTDYPFLKRDGKYHISIRIKADSAKADKDAIAVGYFHKKRGFVTFHKIKGSELKKDYTWIDCGTFSRPGGFGNLYVYTISPDAAKNVRLDALELIPVK